MNLSMQFHRISPQVGGVFFEVFGLSFVLEQQDADLAEPLVLAGLAVVGG